MSLFRFASCRILSSGSLKTLPSSRSFSLTSGNGQINVAVVLSGCGVYDGSELNEASAILVHLTRLGLRPVCYSPNREQLHTVNHNKGTSSEEDKRNMLIESSRISRGECHPLSELEAANAAAVIFPGGFGVAKNLSNFASKGVDMKVDDDVERVLRDFHQAKKPIAMCCIAPILAAKVFQNVSITLGCSDTSSGKWPHAGAIEAAKAMGANVVEKRVDEVNIDKENLVLTTPCFMYEGEMYEMFDGVGELVKELNKILQN